MEVLAIIGVLILFILFIILLILSTKHNHCMKCIYNECHKICDNDKPNDNIIDRWK